MTWRSLSNENDVKSDVAGYEKAIQKGNDHNNNFDNKNNHNNRI